MYVDRMTRDAIPRPLQVFVVIVEGDPREAIHKSALRVVDVMC